MALSLSPTNTIVMQIRNTITLIGNVGQQPEMRQTKTGAAMISFNLATNDTWTDKNGERQTRTEWHKIVSFGNQAESLGKMLKKGSKLALTGSLRYNSWKDSNDKQHTTANIHLNDFMMLSPKES